MALTRFSLTPLLVCKYDGGYPQSTSWLK